MSYSSNQLQLCRASVCRLECQDSVSSGIRRDVPMAGEISRWGATEDPKDLKEAHEIS